MAVGTTAFPTALDTAVELVELTNNASSLLSANVLVGATTITVDDPSEFPTTGFATLVDDLTTPTKIEIISWTGKSGSDLTGVLKGRQGSSDQAWSLGDNIEIRPTKGPHEALRGAMIAVETKLGYGASTSTANTVLLGNGTGTSAWGAITNAYIDASAAIAHSKMAALTASRAMVTDVSGFSSASSVTATELGYLSGVSSAIQTQLNAKQASDATLTALAAYNTNGLLTQTAADTFTGRTITGTTDVITVTNGDGVSGNPTITIAATYVGQNTITTLGTVTTGTLSTGAVVGGVTLTLGSDGTGDIYYRSAGGVLTRLAIGTEDQVLSVSAGGLPEWSAVAGTGDVVGPASATDNAVVRFDLTTGKLVQDSVVTIADTTGNMAGVGTLNAHTIPGGTDTFALLAASQTFTNKTLTAPDINGGTADALTSLGIRSIGTGAFDLTFANTENLAAGRSLTLKVNDADRTIDIAGNITTAAAFITSGANSLTLTTTGATNVTLPTSGTLAIVGGTLAQFAATTSAQLAGVISDETGSGALVFGTAPTFASTITVGTAGGTTGAIDLKGTTSGTVTLKVADAAGTYTLTLPTTDGDASQFLQTDGAGVLTWATGGGGLTVGTTAIASGTAGRILYEASGNVLGEAAGLTYQTGASPTLTATAQNATYVGLRINSASTPSADVFQVSADNGTTTHFSVPSTGGARLRPTAASRTSFEVDHSDGTLRASLGVLTGSTGFGALWLGSLTPSDANYTVLSDGSDLYLNAPGSTARRVYIRTGNYSAPSMAIFDGSVAGGSLLLNTTTINAHLYAVSGATTRVGLRIDSAANSTVALNQFFLNADDTNAVAPHSVFSVDSNGTAANGLGGRLQFQLESSTTNQQDAAAIDWLWTDATHASRTAKVTLSLVGNAAALAAVAEFDMSTTATHTRFLIYDVDNATLERVTVGAADSGGAGFKVLRIAN